MCATMQMCNFFYRIIGEDIRKWPRLVLSIVLLIYHWHFVVSYTWRDWVVGFIENYFYQCFFQLTEA